MTKEENFVHVMKYVWVWCVYKEQVEISVFNISDLWIKYIIWQHTPIISSSFLFTLGHVEALNLQTYLAIKTHINSIPHALAFQLQIQIYHNDRIAPLTHAQLQ